MAGMRCSRIIMNYESVGLWNVVSFSVSSRIFSADTEENFLRITVKVTNFTQDPNWIPPERE
jgi:hypothetical protein